VPRERKTATVTAAPATDARQWGGLPRGATVLVDTAPWIYLLEDHTTLSDRFAGLFEGAMRGDIDIALSSITVAEILTGPYKSNKAALAKRFEAVLRTYRIVPLTTQIASLAAQMRALYRLKLPDAVQLASALDIGAAALVTHDRDFSAVKDLPIVAG